MISRKDSQRKTVVAPAARRPPPPGNLKTSQKAVLGVGVVVAQKAIAPSPVLTTTAPKFKLNLSAAVVRSVFADPMLNGIPLNVPPTTVNNVGAADPLADTAGNVEFSMSVDVDEATTAKKTLLNPLADTAGNLEFSMSVDEATTAKFHLEGTECFDSPRGFDSPRSKLLSKKGFGSTDVQFFARSVGGTGFGIILPKSMVGGGPDPAAYTVPTWELKKGTLWTTDPISEAIEKFYSDPERWALGVQLDSDWGACSYDFATFRMVTGPESIYPNRSYEVRRWDTEKKRYVTEYEE